MTDHEWLIWYRNWLCAEHNVRSPIPATRVIEMIDDQLGLTMSRESDVPRGTSTADHTIDCNGVVVDYNTHTADKGRLKKGPVAAERDAEWAQNLGKNARVAADIADQRPDWVSEAEKRIDAPARSAEPYDRYQWEKRAADVLNEAFDDYLPAPDILEEPL